MHVETNAIKISQLNYKECPAAKSMEMQTNNINMAFSLKFETQMWLNKLWALEKFKINQFNIHTIPVFYFTFNLLAFYGEMQVSECGNMHNKILLIYNSFNVSPEVY